MKNWKYIEGAKTGNICSGNKKQDWDVGGNIDWDVGNFNGQWYVTKNGQKLVGPFMSMKEAERYLDGHKWELQNKYGNSKIGNTAHSDKVEVIKRLLHANWSVQEIYELLKKEGYEVDKNFIERMKVGNDTPLEYARRKPRVINEDKTGAEEFFKQLSDDVKEREEKDDADIEKVGNFKTGTSQLKPGDKVMSFGKKGTVKEVIGENTDNIYGEPLIKVEFEDGTTKTIGEHYMRKVGNKTTQVAQVGTVKILYDDKDNVYYTNVGGSIFNNPSFKTKEEAVKYTVQKNKVGNKKLKFTDKQDGLKEFVYDEENDKGYIYYDGKLVDTIPHAGQGWLNLIKQKAFSSGVMNKVGNKVVWKEGPYRIEEVEKDGKFGFYNIPKGSFNAYRNSVLYGNFETLDSAKAKMNEEIRLDKEYNRKYTTNSKTGNKEYSTDDFKRIKEEALRIAQTTKDEEKKKRALKIADYMKYAHNQPDWGKIVDRYDQELKQIGNSAYDDGAKKGKEDKRKGKLITAAGFEYHAPGYSSLSFKEKEEYKKGYYSTNDLKKEDIYKWGNSASDDKFAYVMREFDEGKLKTPDGKVVTDPAQAKAIAYSESKKTENGLSRARKAMNAWNSERKIEPVGKYKEFIDNLKNAIELGVAGVLYNSLDEQTVKEWVEKAKKEGYGSHISGVQGKKVILK